MIGLVMNGQGTTAPGSITQKGGGNYRRELERKYQAMYANQIMSSTGNSNAGELGTHGRGLHKYKYKN